MKLIYAFVVWFAMAILIGVGIWLAVAKGSPWLMILSLIGFVVGVAKIGCTTH